MTLRTKVVLSLVLLSAFAAVAIGAVSYRATAQQLDKVVDESLDNAVSTVLRQPNTPDATENALRVGRARFRDLADVEVFTGQFLGPRGRVVTSAGDDQLPVNAEERALASAAQGGQEVRRDVTVAGVDQRMVTTSLGQGRGAVQIARSLEENQRILARLRLRTLIATVIVIVVAAGIGWLLARQFTERLRRLTATAESVAETGRLDAPVPGEGSDETGRLAGAFNRMLAALATSKADQQRLAQDAGHELRTPLTSLRTNIDVLRLHDDLLPDDRARLLADLDGEARELSTLVDELVDLATDRRAEEAPEPVHLAGIAESVAARARRRTGRDVVVNADGSVVTGRRSTIERAVSNLVDNAIKFDDAGSSPVEIEVRHGQVAVLDRGPGVDPADVPHLFDRFYRSASARSRPGSGLGLAIVADMARSSGGTVFASPRDGGGAAIGFTLPLTPTTPVPPTP